MKPCLDLRTFDFDLFRDYEPIDVMVDLSSFITAPSSMAAYRSIMIVQDILSVIIGLYLEPNDFYYARFRQLFAEFGASVFRRLSHRFISIIGTI